MKVFLSSPLRSLLVGLFCVVLAALLSFPIEEFSALQMSHWVSVWVVLLGHLLSGFTFENLLKFPGERSSLLIIPSFAIWFFCCIFVVLLFRLPYSITFIVKGGFLVLACRFIIFFLYQRFYTKILAYIPLGKAINIDKVKGAKWFRLAIPNLHNVHVEAIVADLHSPDLGDAWQKFLADCTLKGIPVYHVKQIEESLTGRVKIRHMYENDLGSLQPSKTYLMLKQVLDCCFVLLVSPFVLLILFFMGIIIKLDDGGPVFFIQKRVGYRGVPFSVFKLRSMKATSPTQATVLGDNRITRVGKFMRKTRIDELPQLFNVLLGQMSLIGPRAEYTVFAEDLEKDVPFYNYRHIVKPGISGWAQVLQGYTTGSEETQVKVEYDFFYIKNYSFSLDVLIFLKTIQTMLTGFGSR